MQINKKKVFNMSGDCEMCGNHTIECICHVIISHTIEDFILVSEANKNDHYHSKSLRKNFLKNVLLYDMYIRYHLIICSIKLPVKVEIIRISPRAMDSDNYQIAVKTIRDVIADWFIPGKQMGRADSDPRIEWIYIQQKGKPKQYALTINIISKNK